MPQTPKRHFNWLRLIGPAMLLGLVIWTGPEHLWSIIRKANPLWLVAAWLLNFPQLGLKAWRWFLMIRWQGMALSYKRAFLSYFSALLVGFLTPGRLGEMVKVFTLKHEAGATLARGLSSVLLDRMFDLYLLILLGSLGMVRFAVVGTSMPWPVFVGLCIVLAIPLFFLHAGVVRWTGERLVRFPVLRHRADWINERIDQFADGLSVMRPVRIVLCAVLTAAAYMLVFVQCDLCARALGFRVPFIDLAMLIAATNFLTFIPITMSGLGTREFCLIYFLAHVAPPQTAAVAVGFGLTIFAVFFVGGGLIGLVCWTIAPIKLRQ